MLQFCIRGEQDNLGRWKEGEPGREREGGGKETGSGTVGGGRERGIEGQEISYKNM